MTTIEHKQIKGITIKNIVVTIASTASIVISIMTTYFGLKSDIQSIRSSQENEAKINDLRLKALEEQIPLLQKEVNQLQLKGGHYAPLPSVLFHVKTKDSVMLIANEKK